MAASSSTTSMPDADRDPLESVEAHVLAYTREIPTLIASSSDLVLNASTFTPPELRVLRRNKEVKQKIALLKGHTEEILRLQRVCRRFRRQLTELQTSLAPVTLLPANVLRLVFSFLSALNQAPMLQDKLPVVMCISQVSTSWRKVALQYPALWDIEYNAKYKRTMMGELLDSRSQPLTQPIDTYCILKSTNCEQYA